MTKHEICDINAYEAKTMINIEKYLKNLVKGSKNPSLDGMKYFMENINKKIVLEKEYQEEKIEILNRYFKGENK